MRVLHRRPRLYQQFANDTDCLRRDKCNDYWDDTGEVGTFMRQKRTIFCGCIFTSDDCEEVIARQAFPRNEVGSKEVGDLTGRGAAFVT